MGFVPDNTPRDEKGFAILQPKCSKLYKKINYNSGADLIQNRIYEYDIRSANTSALRLCKKLKPETLTMLEELPKHDREVYIGKMIPEDPSIREAIAYGIETAKANLFIHNGIQDEEVQAIRNDAVYVIGRRLPMTKFGPMEFKLKHMYSMYMNMDKLEIYYDRRRHTIDVKGLKDEIVEEPDHQKGIIIFLTTVMEHLVMDRRDALRRYLIEFSDQYKRKELPIEYYREFNRYNIYRTSMELNGWCLNMTQVSPSDYDIVNGVYNYKRFVLPMIQRFI